MKCPFCDTEELLSEQDLNIHLLKEHSDKIFSADLFRNVTQSSNAQAKMNTLMNVAAALATIAYQSNLPTGKILATYSSILKELMSLR